MWSLGLLLATACCSAYASPRLDKRNIVANTAIKGSYDFVIVGGGTAGLVLASRLSEDSNHTVLVLEAGDTGDQVSERIDTPSEAYANGLVGTSYDWSYQTVSIPTAGNRVQTWPRGKVLGGSSAINGLYAVRPSQLEYDTWSSMLDGASGADVWNWANQLQRMKTSETFTSPSGAMASADTLEYNAASHGTNGPLDVSWPGYMLPVVGNWSSTLAANGIPTNADPYGGSNAGAFIALSALNPSNWTRSYSRAAYLDPLPPRSNLDVVVNQTVTRLIFNSSDSSNITATGVEFAQDSASARQTVTVNKEVIMAGGSIGTPNVLLHSGVGPSDVLQSAGVGVNLALPGVGQHLMDHISTGVSWTTTAETEAELRNAGDSSAVFLGFVNAAEAYINASTLLGANYSTMQQNVSNSMNTYAGTLVPSSDATVIAGYKAIYQVVADTFMPSALGHTELLLATNGQASGSQTIEIQVALQHPFSQGHLYISSNDSFAAPTIDPAYLSHPFDVVALREGLKFARKVGQTAPLSQYLTTETWPGSSVNTDDEWDTWLANAIATEYHPAGTCAMLSKEKGGVVDTNLLVYGTTNVRVADASVFPIEFAAHLQLSVYALAETAAELIRAEYNGTPALGETASSTAASASSTSKSQKTTSGAGPALNFAVSASALAACVLGAVASGMFIF